MARHRLTANIRQPSGKPTRPAGDASTPRIRASILRKGKALCLPHRRLGGHPDRILGTTQLWGMAQVQLARGLDRRAVEGRRPTPSAEDRHLAERVCRSAATRKPRPSHVGRGSNRMPGRSARAPKPADKPGSVSQVHDRYRSWIRATVIYLDRRLPAVSSGLPGTRARRATSRPPKRARPCLALLPVGVAWPRMSPRAPVVSYTTFSPSPWRHWLCAARTSTAVCFSVALFRQVTLPGYYPAPRPVEPGLSSPRERGATVWPAQV